MPMLDRALDLYVRSSDVQAPSNLRDVSAGNRNDYGGTESAILQALAFHTNSFDYVTLISERSARGGLFIRDGELCLWGIDRNQPLRRVHLTLQIDGKQICDIMTDPASGSVTHATGRRLARHRILEVTIDDIAVRGPAFAALEFWQTAEQRHAALFQLRGLAESYRDQRSRRCLTENIPKTMKRLDRASDGAPRARVSPFVRYLAQRTNTNTVLNGPLPVANWLISEVFENALQCEMFCLTEETLGILLESVFSKRAIRQEINLALFAFWRRHYPHIDILSDAGLRTIQYKFVSAPFIRSKNNCCLLTQTIRDRLAGPADIPRSGPLSWSWYWMFLHEDLGEAEKLRDPQYLRALSFKEVACDLLDPGRTSFNPRGWHSFWSAWIPQGDLMLSRFDLALVSLLADTTFPEQAIAEHGTPYWQQRLSDEIYSSMPELADLSAITAVRVFARPEDVVEQCDLVIIGHANASGLGRNMTMFAEALAPYSPLLFNVDDGRCINPDNGSDLAVSVRARVALLCVNADRVPEVVARFAPIIEDAHVIGFFLWETDRPPEAHVLGASVVDDIWVPTQYVADAYRKITSVPVSVVRKGLRLPVSVSPELFKSRFRRTDDAFTFVSLAEFGSSIIRKNPLDCIKAFQIAFPDNKHVRFLLKIREINASHWSNLDGYWEELDDRISGDPRIEIIEGDLSDEEYWGLLANADAFVSLHRSEGFGYGISDSLLLGKPVVVSDYSGPVDFCNEDTAFLVEVNITPTPPEQLGCRTYIGNWSVPRLESAAAAMRQVLAKPDEAARRACLGRQRIIEQYSFEDWRADLTSRLESILVEQH